MTGIEHATPLMIIFLIAVILFLLRYTKEGTQNPVQIRRILGLDAIHAGLGSAAEVGRPVAFNTGITSVGPVLYACLGILRYVAKFCALYRNKIFVPQNSPEAMVMVENTVREGYQDAGLESHFDPSSIRFLSEEQFAFASGYMGLVHREKVGTAYLFGSFAAESLILAEAGQQVGAMQVAGSISPEQVPFFICTCDYTLIGEELFAASAYLSKDRIELGSLVTQDLIKMILMTLIFIGALLMTIDLQYLQKAILWSW